MTMNPEVMTPELAVPGTIRRSGDRISFHATGQWVSRLVPGFALRMRGFAGVVDHDAVVARRDYLGDTVYRVAVWRNDISRK